MTDRLFQCPHCDRTFSAELDRWQHARSKHKGAANLKSLRPKRERESDDEPSMGELVAEAHWNPDSEFDWVREMFDVRHPTRGAR